MSDLFISWKTYYDSIEQLAYQINRSNWQFTHLVAIAKGGLRIGDTFSRIFDRPLAILSASSYYGELYRQQEKVKIAPELSSIEPISPKVLLVDDLVDSGETVLEVKEWLKEHYPHIEEIKLAVLWYKQKSKVVPDYYIKIIPNHSWVHQPFEKYENWDWLDYYGQLNQKK